MTTLASSYPVTLEAERPRRYERVQVGLRVVLLCLLGLLHQTLGGVFGVLYLALPVVAALVIARKGTAGVRGDDVRAFVGALDWVVGFYAYLLFVTDSFPGRVADRASHLWVQPTGSPSVGRALARLVTSLPHAVVLAVLGVASGVVAFVIAVSVLVTERCPEALHAFQRDVVTWMARFFAYHSSLVEEYPPFSFGTAGSTHAHP